LLLCYSSFVHRCCVVFCCSLALLGTCLPLVVSLFLHVLLLFSASLFPCPHWYPPCFYCSVLEV
jgi:hypothetical protein